MSRAETWSLVVGGLGLVLSVAALVLGLWRATQMTPRLSVTCSVRWAEPWTRKPVLRMTIDVVNVGGSATTVIELYCVHKWKHGAGLRTRWNASRGDSDVVGRFHGPPLPYVIPPNFKETWSLEVRPRKLTRDHRVDLSLNDRESLLREGEIGELEFATRAVVVVPRPRSFLRWLLHLRDRPLMRVQSQAIGAPSRQHVEEDLALGPGGAQII